MNALKGLLLLAVVVSFGGFPIGAQAKTKLARERDAEKTRAESAESEALAAPAVMEDLRARSNPPVFRTLQWAHRALVLTGEPDDPRVNEQMQVFRDHREMLAQRHVVMIRFMRDNLDEIDELSDYNYRGWYDMNAEQQRFMERQLGTDNNVFSVVLVGMDGALKQVWAPPEGVVPIGAVLAMIDSMARGAEAQPPEEKTLDTALEKTLKKKR